MSTPSSPQAAEAPLSQRAVSPSDRSSILTAVQQRSAAAKIQPSQYDSERDARQAFRRGVAAINRNDPRRARASLELLLKLCDNILREPENTKYHSFKPTNTLIKRDLVEVKNGVEFAILLGFRAAVHDFQPVYEWTPKHLDEVRIGADMIREDLALQDEKQLQAEANMVANKHAAKEAAEKVKLQYEEDRRKKAERDRMEKERRIAGAAASAASPAPPARPAPTANTNSMRGIRSEGHLLSGGVAPPPYGAATAAATDNDLEGEDEDEDEDDSHDGGNPPGFDGSGRRLGD